jgi:hypothetical protein
VEGKKIERGGPWWRKMAVQNVNCNHDEYIPLQQQIALGFLASNARITSTWVTLTLMQEPTRLSFGQEYEKFGIFNSTTYDDCTALFQAPARIEDTGTGNKCPWFTVATDY